LVSATNATNLYRSYVYNKTGGIKGLIMVLCGNDVQSYDYSMKWLSHAAKCTNHDDGCEYLIPKNQPS